MKLITFKLSKIAAMIAGILLFSACSEDPVMEPEISVSVSKLTFEAETTGEKSVTIETNASDWTYEAEPVSWLHVQRPSQRRDSDADLSQLIVSVDDYTNVSESRTATITVTATIKGKYATAYFVVEQTQKHKNSLSISESSLSFGANESGKKTVDVLTDAPSWDANVYPQAMWIQITKQNKQLEINVSPNTGAESRMAVVTLKAGNADDVTLTVSQDGKHSLSVYPTTFTFDPIASSQTAVVQTSAPDWSVSVTSGESWLTATTDNNNLIVAVTRNTTTSSRNGVIRLSAGSASDVTITVTQVADNLSIQPTSLSFDSFESSQTVTVQTNAPNYTVSVTSGAGWLSATPDNDKVIITATRNTTTASRNGVVRVTTGVVESTISVTQTADYLNANNTTLTFGAKETSEKSVTITTNITDWNFTNDAAWLKVTRNGNSLVVNPTSENSALTARTTDIILKAGYAPQITISVTQSPATKNTLSVSPSEQIFEFNGTSNKDFIVTTDASDWNAIKVTNASWLNISKVGNRLTVVPASQNQSNVARTENITITAGNADPVTVKVTQNQPPPWPSRSSYSATGTPLWNSPNGYNYTSWTGEVYPNSTTNPTRFTITGWAHSSQSIYLDYVSGQFRLDRTTKLFNDNTGLWGAYVCWGTWNAATKTVTYYLDDDWTISYNRVTRVFDPGTYNGLPVVIAILPRRNSTGQWDIESMFLNEYYNVKISLTSTSSAPQTRSGAKESDFEIKKLPSDVKATTAKQ